MSPPNTANPNGARAGTAFFGGPKSTGGINGLQAEYARTALANSSLVKLPDSIDVDIGRLAGRQETARQQGVRRSAMSTRRIQSKRY